jgi:predicted  nucleic acid-binding Zn-ribbon protein
MFAHKLYIIMEYKQNNKGLKVVVGALALFLIGSLGYIFKMAADAESVRSELQKALSEKESVKKNLQALKITYDEAISEKTAMSEELIQERDKVVRLMNELNKSKGDDTSMAKYKAQYFVLQQKMKVLLTENENLKKQNNSLALQRDSTVTVLNESKKINKALVGQNYELEKAVEKGSKLNILNPKISAYKVKPSGKQIETDKASNTNILKISFVIAENQIAKAENKLFYIQVLDSKYNVLGDKKTISFANNTIKYSFVSNVKYENKNVEVFETLAADYFEKGTYFINIFDKDELVSKATFSLR